MRCTRHGGTFDFEYHEEALGHGSRGESSSKVPPSRAESWGMFDQSKFMRNGWSEERSLLRVMVANELVEMEEREININCIDRFARWDFSLRIL